MKRIYYISNMFPSKYTNDNYGIFCKKVYEGFELSGIQVTLLSVIQGKSFNKLFNIFRYIRLCIDIWCKCLFCSKKFDAIYFQYVWLHVFCSVPLFHFLKKQGKKIIINFHGEDLLDFVNNPQKSLYKKILDSADLIIFPSAYYKNWLLSVFNVSEKKLFVSASGGVDQSIFKYVSRAPLGQTIVFCSRFAEYKGWRDFIDAVSILNKQSIEVKAVMIGYGADLPLVYKKIQELNLTNIISVKTGLSHKEIASEYSSADLFLFTTTTAESLGLVALEAMSCGLPVIGTKIGALPEYIHDGENGFLVDVHSPEQIAEKVKQFFSMSADKRRSFLENAYAVSTRYEMKQVLLGLNKKLVELIDE